jgi:hypothetical protein
MGAQGVLGEGQRGASCFRSIKRDFSGQRRFLYNHLDSNRVMHRQGKGVKPPALLVRRWISLHKSLGLVRHYSGLSLHYNI